LENALENLAFFSEATLKMGIRPMVKSARSISRAQIDIVNSLGDGYVNASAKSTNPYKSQGFYTDGGGLISSITLGLNFNASATAERTSSAETLAFSEHYSGSTMTRGKRLLKSAKRICGRRSLQNTRIERSAAFRAASTSARSAVQPRMNRGFRVILP